MAINQAHEFIIQWHLTERCNLRCAHCYQTGKRPDEMTLQEIRDVTGEIAEMFKSWSDSYGMDFSPSFTVTGGEPFLRKDIFEIIGVISRRGFEVYLLSNGTLITGEKAKRLSSLGVKGVQVSIEGPEDVHNAIRGKESFSSSMRGIQHLLDHGMAVTLNATLSEINAGYFMDMIVLSRLLGVQRLGFSRLVPSGSGENLVDKMLRAEKLKNLYNMIFSMETDGVKIVTGDPVASQLSDSGKGDSSESFPSGGCAAGISGLTVLPDGTVIPCRRLPVSVGNVRKDSLREIWASSEVLASLRNKSEYKGKCSTCSRWSRCRGCRAIAYAWSRACGRDDILAEDPQCFIDG